MNVTAVSADEPRRSNPGFRTSPHRLSTGLSAKDHRVLHTRDITLTELMHEFRHMLDGARKVLDKPLLSPPDSEGDGK